MKEATLTFGGVACATPSPLSRSTEGKNRTLADLASREGAEREGFQPLLPPSQQPSVAPQRSKGRSDPSAARDEATGGLAQRVHPRGATEGRFPSLKNPALNLRWTAPPLRGEATPTGQGIFKGATPERRAERTEGRFPSLKNPTGRSKKCKDRYFKNPLLRWDQR